MSTYPGDSPNSHPETNAATYIEPNASTYPDYNTSAYAGPNAATHAAPDIAIQPELNSGSYSEQGIPPYTLNDIVAIIQALYKQRFDPNDRVMYPYQKLCFDWRDASITEFESPKQMRILDTHSGDEIQFRMIGLVQNRKLPPFGLSFGENSPDNVEQSIQICGKNAIDFVNNMTAIGYILGEFERKVEGEFICNFMPSDGRVLIASCRYLERCRTDDDIEDTVTFDPALEKGGLLQGCVDAGTHRMTHDNVVEYKSADWIKAEGRHVIQDCKPSKIDVNDMVEVVFVIRAYKAYRADKWTAKCILRGVVVLDKQVSFTAKQTRIAKKKQMGFAFPTAKKPARQYAYGPEKRPVQRSSIQSYPNYPSSTLTHYPQQTNQHYPQHPGYRYPQQYTHHYTPYNYSQADECFAQVYRHFPNTGYPSVSPTSSLSSSSSCSSPAPQSEYSAVSSPYSTERHEAVIEDRSQRYIEDRLERMDLDAGVDQYNGHYPVSEP